MFKALLVFFFLDLVIHDVFFLLEALGIGGASISRRIKETPSDRHAD